MTGRIIVGKGPELGAGVLESMFQLRRAQFAERLAWDVNVDRHGREVDWYDALGPTYVVAVEGHQDCVGCMRLLPTTGPNMLGDIFKDTLQCDFSGSRGVWEISRLAIAPGTSPGSWGFGPTAQGLVRAMLTAAWCQGLSAMVGVTTTSVVRLMKGFGLDVDPISSAKLIGDVKSVAFRIPINDAVLNRVGADCPRRAA